MNIEKLLMAFLVPLAFIACSEVDSLVANAPSGESNALSSSVDEVSASSSSVVFDGSEKVYRGVTFYTVPQSTIHIYELDPVTFDTIRSVPYYGRSSYFNNIGRWGASEIDTIVIDSLSLKSPYVMLSTDYYNRRYNIVDIRESNGFAVDKKSIGKRVTVDKASYVDHFIDQGASVKDNAIILGPTTPFVPYENNNYLRLILIKYKKPEEVRSVLEKLVNANSQKGSIGLSVNIDPYNF